MERRGRTSSRIGQRHLEGTSVTRYRDSLRQPSALDTVCSSRLIVHGTYSQQNEHDPPDDVNNAPAVTNRGHDIIDPDREPTARAFV